MFKVGDVVILKGGRPVMTITTIGKDLEGRPRMHCTWFDSQGNEKSSVYMPEALKAYTGEKGEAAESGDFMTS